MIHAIKIQNYQSIRDEVTLDFTVNKQAPANEHFIKSSLPEARVSVIQAFIGANGSGKTTGLRALALVRWLILSSFENDERRIPITQFAGYEKGLRPTNLEVVFEMKKELHTYKVSLTPKRILTEELLVRTRSEKKFTNKRLFLRRWNEETEKYKIIDAGFGISEPFWESGDLGNASIIAVSKKFGNEYASQLVKCWSRSATNIEVRDRFGSYEMSRWYALDYYKSHPKMRGVVEDDIKKYDLGIEGFGKDGTFKHKYDDTFFNIDFDQESSGTQQLLFLKRMIENVLAKGGVAIIDEPDSFLHPLMLRSLIERFSNKEINKGKGQIVFSTHDIYVLDFLEKYEVNLVDKSNGVTSIKRLDAIPGVRNSDNFVKKYFEGDYGGLPVFD